MRLQIFGKYSLVGIRRQLYDYEWNVGIDTCATIHGVSERRLKNIRGFLLEKIKVIYPYERFYTTQNKHTIMNLSSK